MSRRGGKSRLAAGFMLASGVLMLASLAATLATPGPALRVWSTIAFLFPIAASSGAGCLIAWRRPENAIAWILSVIGLLFAIVTACNSISAWGLETGALPRSVGEWIGVGSRFWVPALGLMGTQLLLRFPDGQLLSPRWRAYSRICIALIAMTWVAMSIQPGRVGDVAGTANPLGVEWAKPLESLSTLLLLSFIGAVLSLVLRYRRADSQRRGQLRWIASSAVVFLAVHVVGIALSIALQPPEDSLLAVLQVTFSQVAFAGFPVAIGHAVLRHRLYDIDVVINRTLVYGGLTVMLAASYLGSVLLLQLGFSAFTEGSGLAVAASTLATAALFRPLRTRIQATVDRRFYRRKYDAARTLERFGARLRDEVDLNSLGDELRAVVGETMQPTHVSLWLRDADPSR